MKPNFLVFDVEATSLHGTAFAFGAVVIDRQGVELAAFSLKSAEGEAMANDWVKENVLPHIADMLSVKTDRQLRDLFYDFLRRHKDTCDIWSDCNYPVETNFLAQIVADNPQTREFEMPYPLKDISTVVDISIDRIAHSGLTGLRPHNPLDDARASAACLIKALNKPRDGKTYDSRPDTLLHIKRVAQLLTEAAAEFIRRANVHDNSKLQSPEKELFDEYTSKLATSTYGSPEYKEFLKGLKPALDHHYANNSHHPEHYRNGINGFDLFDLVEMFFDWKAATERHNDGNIYKSIRINKSRFAMSTQLAMIFENTAEKLGWKKHEIEIIGYSTEPLQGKRLAEFYAEERASRPNIIVAPEEVPATNLPKIFLAGTIDMGYSEDWQAKVAHQLSKYNVQILNPRRNNWNKDWEQSINNFEFKEQVTWELDGLDMADIIIVNLLPGSESPISLLEIGMHVAQNKKLFVCCPNEFYRKGNIDIVCRRYGIPVFTNLDELILEVAVKLNRQKTV